MGNQRALVARLANAARAREAPPGVEVCIDGTTRTVAALTVAESLPHLDLVALGADIEARLALAFPATDCAQNYGSAVPRGFRLRQSGNAMIASVTPDQFPDTIGSIVALASARRAINDLWWRCTLDGNHLFAPVLERPVLDTVYSAFVSSQPGGRR